MKNWNYRALTQAGTIESGTRHARHVPDLAASLRQANLELIEAQLTSSRPRRPLFSSLTRDDLIHFTFSLSELLKAGVPLVDGLRDMAATGPNPRLNNLLHSVIHDLEGGLTPSQALAAHPAFFDPIYVALIAAGEASGRLPETLDHAHAALEWHDQIRQRLHSLLIYPALVALVVGGSALFLITYLLPRVQTLSLQLGQKLPYSTEWLQTLSHHLARHGLILAIAFAILTLFLTMFYHHHAGFRQRLHALLLRLPLFGTALQKMELARFSGTLSILHRSGLPALEALEQATPVIANLHLRHAIEQVRQQIAEGHGFGLSFQQAELFPPLVVRMMQLGEQTGRFENALDNIRRYYERDIKTSVDRLLASIEPLMTLILGGLLIGLLLTVFGPIYDLIGHTGTLR